MQILQLPLKQKRLPLPFVTAMFGCTGEYNHLCIKTTHVKRTYIALNKLIAKK
jgi:hypothetical protein